MRIIKHPSAAPVDVNDAVGQIALPFRLLVFTSGGLLDRVEIMVNELLSFR